MNEEASRRATESSVELESTGRLAEALYPELRRIARARMSRERNDHTLQPTALVNELFVQLIQRSSNGDGKTSGWASREHFLLSASRAMHHLLIDHARARAADKRGGDWVRVDFGDPASPSAERWSLEMLDLAELLSKLSKIEPRMADVVRLRFFGGLTLTEIGVVLGFDERTIKRDWTLAREWMKGHMEPK